MPTVRAITPAPAAIEKISSLWTGITLKPKGVMARLYPSPAEESNPFICNTEPGRAISNSSFYCR
jgi:hypothetical protein